MRAAISRHLRPLRVLYHVLDYTGPAYGKANGVLQLSTGEPSAGDGISESERQDISCVEDSWLYLSGLVGVCAASERGIQCIVSIGVTLTDHAKRAHGKDMEYYSFPLEDLPDAPLTGILPSVYWILLRNAERRKRTLVHCQMGISRSASCIIAFFMYRAWHRIWIASHLGGKMRRDFQCTLYRFYRDLVKSKRRCISPNRGFERLLKHSDDIFYLG